MQVRNKFKDFKAASIIFILLFSLINSQSPNYAQDIKSDEKKQNDNQEDIIRVDTNLVTIPTIVLDRNGRFITDLKKEDFQIFENGIEQEVALFEPVEQPFTVLLLLDISGSMTYHMAELTKAANAFVSQLRPNDQVIAATFADNLYILFKATKVSDLRKSIKLEQRSGIHYTRIYDVVHDAIKLIKKAKGRKAIVLFSDGIGDGTFASAEGNFRNAEESEALIYTIKFKNLLDIAPKTAKNQAINKKIEEVSNYMQNLAEISGGRPYQIEKVDDLEKTFGLITDELRQQYNLGYYPKTEGKKGERRQIKVKVNVPNVAVRARESYVIGQKK